MSAETYLNHPTFGLLFRICVIDENSELFSTLYAQRLFFIVTMSGSATRFDPTTRTDARIALETRLRLLRRTGRYTEYDQLMQTYKRTFQ